MSPETKKYLIRLMIVYGVPFLIMSWAVMQEITSGKVVFFAAIWMVVAGLVTRNLR